MTERQKIIIDAIQKFPALPSRAIARYVLYNYGDLFNNHLENIRDAVRRANGTHGKTNNATRNVIPRTAPPVMPVTWREPKEPYILSPGLWLCLFDAHVPFHEPKPLEIAISYGKKQKVNGLFLGGDAQDCAAVSFWVTGRKREFDREFASFVSFLDLLQYEFPKQKKVYKAGNHEYRLPRYYQTRAPELIGLPLAAMETLLDLEGRDIDLVEHKQITLAGKLPILHGHEIPHMSRAVNPARGLFNKIKSWGMCGHCHTTSQHNETNIQGTNLTTWSVGCLCDLHPDFNPYANNWNWGFALINVEKNGDFEVENRRILPSGKIV